MHLFCSLSASLILAVTALPRKKLFSGDGTYYNAGLGSCGVVSHDNQLIVALNAPQMMNGANPNVNKRCGTSIRVNGPKGSVTVKIVDTCPACRYGSLDLSPSAFEHIADLAKGRVPITWNFM
ncbi:hypothetical protein [Absidia glauca]|uniref:RlpA-like protein double-psi beta-barrel domain-containing protein n=1 Tax=Absidia glauca TaxID=4829 RepID=A0A168N7Q7_ABSGL|nr:hypothetical protein [Absidia glauca]